MRRLGEAEKRSTYAYGAARRIEVGIKGQFAHRWLFACQVIWLSQEDL
jgi:hypothetical protein